MTRANKLWSYSTGERGKNRVRAFKKKIAGIIFLEFYEEDPVSFRSMRQRISLGHGDEDLAKSKAEEIALALRKNEAPRPTKLSLKALFDIYEREVTPTKGESKRKHDHVAFQLFVKAFGASRAVETLSLRDWNKYILARQTGVLRPKGGRSGVGNRMIAYDLQALVATLNWAAASRNEQGTLLIEKNPLKGCPFPVESNPIRRAFDRAQYRALVHNASSIHPLFRIAVVITYHTGHRIGAVRHLKWANIDFMKQTIFWSGEHDKVGREHTTPISRELLAILRHEYRARQPSLGTWLFPSPEDAEKPCSRFLMRDWMERGLKRLSIKPGMRYGWHSLRRQFATELKHVPLPDLCALGGWSDPKTIFKCYAQPDDRTMRTALDNRVRL